MAEGWLDELLVDRGSSVGASARSSSERRAGSGWPPPRIAVGRLTVVQPDGSRLVFGDAGASADLRGRSISTTPGTGADAGCTARPVVARPTWTASGRAPTSGRCSGWRPAIARPWRFQQGGSGSPPSSCAPSGIGSSQHEGREPEEHRRALRPEQCAVSAVPRRLDDLLECGLRHARSDPRVGAAQQVPDHGRKRRAVRGPARPRDRHGLGRVRPVRGAASWAAR